MIAKLNALRRETQGVFLLIQDAAAFKVAFLVTLHKINGEILLIPQPAIKIFLLTIALKKYIIIVKKLYYRQMKGKNGTNMKKIICLILTFACVFGLASCGGAKEFIELVNSSEPTTINTVTSFNDGERKLEGKFETVIDGSDFELTYSFQRYTVPGENDDPEAFLTTEEGVIYYKDGKYSKDGETWVTEVPDAVTNQVKLSFDKKNLGDYTVSPDGKTLTANVTSEQAEAMLGINVEATDTVEIIIRHDGTYLRSIQVYYTTDKAESVTISTSYSYLPVSEPEAPEAEGGETGGTETE